MQRKHPSRLIKKIIFIAVILCVLIAALMGYLFFYEPVYSGLISINTSHTMVFAHRGYGSHAPDNSIEGARIAVKTGLDGVDVDAQFSKDKEVVIFHDVSLERFTTGAGRVDAKTLAELQTYDLSTQYGDAAFSGVYIKTFEDFVEEITPAAYLMVELKVAGVSDTGIERRVHEILDTYNAYDRVYISSFNPVVLYRLKHIDERIRTVFIFMDSGWDPKRVAETKEEDRVALPWYLQKEWTRTAIRKIVRPDAVSINGAVHEKTVRKLIGKNYPVFIWDVNSEEAITSALNKNPYGVVSDEPALAKKIRDESLNND